MSPLLRKLRYKPKMRVYLIDAPSGFEAAVVGAGVERVATPMREPMREIDIVHAFFTRLGQVERRLPKLVRHVAPKGIVWLSYPKAKQLATDLNRDVLREAVAPMGLTAVALVSIDDVWSALRCKVNRAG
jgi:hypothetical protein